MDARLREARRAWDQHPSPDNTARLMAEYDRIIGQPDIPVRPMTVSVERGNVTILDMDHARVLIHYQTPVAAIVWHETGPVALQFTGGRAGSKTTARRIREFLGPRADEAEEVDYSVMEDLLRVRAV